MISVTEIGLQDELHSLVDQINTAQWDDANDLSEYSVDALRAYLHKPDTVFVVCYLHEGMRKDLLGIASARLEMKPYDHEIWLYVDEIDVCVNLRRQGAGTAMMNFLFEFAAAHQCTVVWLGTEIDNTPAQGLYRSLQPSEEERFIGYTYEIE